MTNAVNNHNIILTLSKLSILALWIGAKYVEIPYVVNLLVIVTSILYTACHHSLILREEQALARGEVDPTKPKDKNGADAPRPVSETLKAEDAMQFPIIGSITLFGLYCGIKFLDKETINFLLSAYFGLMGCAAITAVFTPLVSAVSGGRFESLKYAKEIKIPHNLPQFIGGDSPWDLSFNVTLDGALAFLGSATVTGFYLKKKLWILNNLMGICFCLKGIEKLSLGTYKIASILLVGLFFYDIFWVFGTDVMVTVAKSIDGPIKLLFPRSLTPDPETGKIELSLLGLGDIVLPGFFLALLLRFDAHQAKVPYFPTDIHHSFPKPYFHSGIVGYVLGMAMTMFVMIHFQAAQPALLYLVPACLGSSFITAMVRGEVNALLEYSEEVEEEEGEDEKNKEKDESAKKDD